MKKITFIFALGFIALSFNSFSQIKVSSTGKVGINNTNPTYQLDVNGSFRISDYSNSIIIDGDGLYPTSLSMMSSLGNEFNKWEYLYANNAWFLYFTVNSSDENLKKDIKDIEFTKDKLKELRPVRYKFKSVEKTDINGNVITNSTPEVEQIGFIAQEMQKVFPEIVVEDKNGTLGIQYTALIPVLVKALQEQQAEIDDLKLRIEKLESAK